MRFENTCIESIAVALPGEIRTSGQIEEWLRPVYERLRLPFGRLELMTGIRERRVWPEGMRASEASAAAGREVLARSALRKDQIGLFIHAAVCRDMLEPATASFVHHRLGLSPSAQIFDVSNACLGFVNALTIAAGMIESDQIGCAMIVAGENGRPLVEETIRTLTGQPLDRNAIKPFFANLTIGCGAAAAIVCHRRMISGPAHRLVHGVVRAATKSSDLCQGDIRGAGFAMQTDSEGLLDAGVALARETWAEFAAAPGWGAASIDRIVTHQVGAAHRRRLYEALNLDLSKDFSTFEIFGNMGSVSLPATLSAAVAAGAVQEGGRVALLGIGSGLNSLMLGLEW